MTLNKSAALSAAPPLMGGCASREADAASATVHAADALTPGTPAVNHKTPHAAPASLDTRAADPGRAAVARYAKRGAVGEAEHVSEAEETLESLPKAPKSAAETTLIKAAIADNILFKVRTAHKPYLVLCRNY